MLNARIHKTGVQTRIENAVPNARTSSFQTAREDSVASISVGMPIGLLLALTYASVPASDFFYGDYRPNARIVTN